MGQNVHRMHLLEQTEDSFLLCQTHRNIVKSRESGRNFVRVFKTSKFSRKCANISFAVVFASWDQSTHKFELTWSQFYVEVEYEAGLVRATRNPEFSPRAQIASFGRYLMITGSPHESNLKFEVLAKFRPCTVLLL